MRDETIFKMQEENGRRSALILRQMEFIETRIRAFEKTFFLDRWSVLKLLWNPTDFLWRVDNMQRQFLAQAAKEFADAQKKVKIEPVGLVH